MVRIFWIFVVTVTAMTGCRNHCCLRSPCTACPPPAPFISSNAIAAPVPIGTRPPEVLLPSNTPPPVTPPSTSGFAPVPASTNQPGVTLQAPEFASDQPRVNPASRTAGPMPSTIKPIVAGKLFTGNKPSLDDVDRLASAGVKQVAFLTETDKAMDTSVFANRGIEVTTIRAGQDALGELNVLRNRGPVFVFSDDNETLRSFWKRYYREVELLSDDAARVCADSITMN